MPHRALLLALVAGAASTAVAVASAAPASDRSAATSSPAAEALSAVEAPSAAGAAVGPTDPEPSAVTEPEPELDPSFVVDRRDDPPRTVVEDADGAWVATFTDGASTVALAGEERTFDEPTATHAVTTDTWVRLLPEPFDGEVDPVWLEDALVDDRPDVLEISTQYWTGAPEALDEDGVMIAGDASYGPLQPDGTRAIGGDWHDYRGVDAVYGRKVDPAKPAEYGALDCSGYTRTVFGARLRMPLSLRPDGGTSLPRRSFEQAQEAPGIVPMDGGQLHTDRLQAGDLVFFDLQDTRAGGIDHVGIYLGVDDAGERRFIHSRRSTDGPTMGGDEFGPSILEGDGVYASGFVSTRRL